VSVAAVALCASSALAQVVPDGGTTTTAVTAATGRVTVNIAPVVTNGISHNTYTRFSVPPPGVDLNNVGVGARTIVNQVTGADPSRLQGPLAVLGAPAHVILANANGVTVDGGSFVNTGRVALSTGAVSFVDRNATLLTTQRNVVLTTSSGEIRIEGAGLAGTFSHLELLAKSIRIDAPVRTDSLAPSREVRLTAGASRAEFDSSVFPANTLSPWAAITPGAASSPGVVLADITALGNVQAGTIKIAITDAGAGVRHAGSLAAAAGDFTLTADGSVVIEGGRVTAAQDILVRAGALTAGPAASGSPYVLAADRHVDLGVGAATVTGGSIAAGSLGVGGDVTLGAETMSATGAFTLTGRDTPAGYERLDVTVRGGGFGLFAATQDALLSGVSIAANQLARLVARRLALESPQAANGARQASSLAAGRVDGSFSESFTLRGAVLRGNVGVELEAGSIDAAAVGSGAGFAPAAIIADAGNARLFADGAIGLVGTDVLGQQHVSIEGDSVRVAAASRGSGLRESQATAATGALVVSALAGDLVNDGSLLQGTVRDATNPGSFGGATLQAAGSIVNRSLAPGRLAIVFAQADALYANAGGDLVNRAGRLIANGDVTLVAGGRFDNVIDQVEIPNAGVRVDYSSRGGAQFFRGKKTTGFSVEYGDLVVPGQLAYVVADGAVSIDAAAVTNRGGEVDANRGDILVTTGRLDNEALVTGRAQFARTCAWFCTERGASTLTLNGGTFAASRDILIDATDAVTNTAGQFLALRDLTVNAPSVRTTGLALYRYLERPSGFGSVVGGDRGRLRRIDQGGAFIANMGRLTLNTASPVRVERGTLQGGAGVDVPAGQDIVATPAVEPLTDVRHIGAARGLLFQ
jgi:filamentous hemagglutinin family protein